VVAHVEELAERPPIVPAESTVVSRLPCDPHVISEWKALRQR
jgi:hypothetical protein